MLVRGFVRYVNTGSPVPDGTEVQFRREVDDSLIATVVTVGGMYEYEQHGSPGPYKVRAAIDDEVHITSSMVVGMSGPVDIGGLPLYFRLWKDGYIGGVLDELEVFASGAAMQASVRAGAAIIKGVLYDQGGVVNLPIDAPDTQARIDTVVVEVMLPGSGRTVEGRSRLVVKKGTPSASPAAPALTQTTTIWEYPLGDVRVDPGVSTIASNKVTARSSEAVTFIGPQQIENGMIADEAVTRSKIDLSDLDVRYYTENEISTLLANRRPKHNAGAFTANQTVSTAGLRQVMNSGTPVGDLGFSGLLPSTQYRVEVSLAYKIEGGPNTSVSIGYQAIGEATAGANTANIPIPDASNYLTWTWSGISTSSPGGAITVRPITQWGLGSYTVTWISISARLDLAE